MCACVCVCMCVCACECECVRAYGINSRFLWRCVDSGYSPSVCRSVWEAVSFLRLFLPRSASHSVRGRGWGRGWGRGRGRGRGRSRAGAGAGGHEGFSALVTPRSLLGS